MICYILNQKQLIFFYKLATNRFWSILFISKIFRFTKKTTRKTVQNQQTSKDVENICTNIAGFDVICDKLRDVFREAWNVED